MSPERTTSSIFLEIQPSLQETRQSFWLCILWIFSAFQSGILGSFAKMSWPGKAPKITPNVIDLGAAR